METILRGVPLPFVPYDDNWAPDQDPPAFRGLYRASLERYGAVSIPVERAPVLNIPL